MQTRPAALLAAALIGLAAPAQALEAPNAAYAQYIQTGPQVGTPGQTSRPVPIGRGAAPAPQAQPGRGPVVQQGRGPAPGGYGYRRERRGPSGGAVAAGVIGGLAAGALIGGAIANQQQPVAAPRPPGLVDPDVADWCAARYRTYDYRSGTYLSPSGERLVCNP